MASGRWRSGVRAPGPTRAPASAYSITISTCRGPGMGMGGATGGNQKLGKGVGHTRAPASARSVTISTCGVGPRQASAFVEPRATWVDGQSAGAGSQKGSTAHTTACTAQHPHLSSLLVFNDFKQADQVGVVECPHHLHLSTQVRGGAAARPCSSPGSAGARPGGCCCGGCGGSGSAGCG